MIKSSEFYIQPDRITTKNTEEFFNLLLKADNEADNVVEVNGGTYEGEPFLTAEITIDGRMVSVYLY